MGGRPALKSLPRRATQPDGENRLQHGPAGLFSVS